MFAVPAVLLLCAYLACYPAIAGWLTVLHRWESPIASALVLAVAWAAGEAVRGTLFGGFPWNLIGYAFAQSTAISQLAALTGIYGLSLLAVALGALPAIWLDRSERARWQPLAAGATILATIWVGGAIRLADGERPAGRRRAPASGSGQYPTRGEMAARGARARLRAPPDPVVRSAAAK